MYQYNGKELVDDNGLGWHSYGKRYYDAAICRFPNVDPLIDTFHFVTGYNYAENEPVAHIDLWGLQKAEPWIRASAKAAITTNTTGFETRVFGSQEGGTLKVLSQDVVSGEITADNSSGVKVSGALMGSNGDITSGASVGDFLGGSAEFVGNDVNKETKGTAVVSLGPVYLKNEVITTGGQSKLQTYVGIQVGATAALGAGVDVNASLELNVSRPQAPANTEPRPQPMMQPDNTKMVVPILPIRVGN